METEAEEARLRALVANPMVRSYDQAAGLLMIIYEQDRWAPKERMRAGHIRRHEAPRSHDARLCP